MIKPEDIKTFRELFEYYKEQDEEHIVELCGKTVLILSSAVLMGAPQQVLERIEIALDPEKADFSELLGHADPAVSLAAKLAQRMKEMAARSAELQSTSDHVVNWCVEIAELCVDLGALQYGYVPYQSMLRLAMAAVMV